MVKLSKQDRELLVLMADDPERLGHVDYVPGTWHPTNAEGRTRWSYQRYQPRTYGFKDFVRVTAPVSRLREAGLVELDSPDTPERRCRVRVTRRGHEWLEEHRGRERTSRNA